MRTYIHSRFILTFLLLTGIFSFSIAAPHNGDEFMLTQPDGSTVPVLIWGDEFYQHVESPDGHTLVRNKATGWICYATLSEDSLELLPTDNIYKPVPGLSKSLTPSVELPPAHLKIHRSSRLSKHKRMQQQINSSTPDESPSTIMPAAPSSSDTPAAISPLAGVKTKFGKYIGITILIDFSDVKGTVPIDSIKDFVNKRGYTGFGNSGSIRDFYYDVSGGKVDYENIVVGYYRAKNAKSYYDSRDVAFGNRSQELILEALSWLQADGFDFNQLTQYASSATSTRKKIAAINVFYAGTPSQGWSEGLWPHQGRLNNVRMGEIYADVYQMSNIGTSINMGTFCHENGHMLFSWPDLYDYGGESGGVGVYCLMCNTGRKNPIPPCAYLRDVSGWDAVTDITTMPEGTVLTLLPDEQNKSVTYRNTANKNEMFYIEARRAKGRYKDLPDSGFMIWHVDRSGSNNNEQATAQSHYLVSLEQADNALELEKSINSGRRGDFFRGGYKDAFDDATQPNAHWWNGSNSGMKIASMSTVADTMSFTIGKSSTSLHTIIVSGGPNGTVTPSGKISAVAGSTLKFSLQPDSGFTIDAITIDDAPVAVVDTLRLQNITAPHTIKVAFGLNAALSVVFPQEDAVLYAGDTATIMWRTRGVTVTSFNASYSTNRGASFTPIASSIPATDTVFRWKVPVVESDSCVIKVSDSDGTPETRSAIFSIRKKPSIAVAAGPLVFSVEPGKSIQQTFTINNVGTGELGISATTWRQTKSVLINELFIGTDGNDINDGIEIWNSGTDIDLSGWQLSFAYNQLPANYYTFPEGFILKGGAAFYLYDKEHAINDSTAYIGIDLPWSYSQGLDLSITLLDAGGRGIDFVKSSTNADRAPEGTVWKGSGVDLNNAYVYRKGTVDSDTASDWESGATGTLKRINTAQQVVSHPLLRVTPLSGKTQGDAQLPLTLNLDAVDKVEGTYYDTLLIRHNDPSKPSPLLIPCIINVTSAIKVRTAQALATTTSAPRFIAAPNPVSPGDNVLFHYQPQGDERSGTLLIYNSVGDCLFTDNIDFSRVTVFNKQPVRFSWLPPKLYRQRSCLARLIIIRANGSKEIYSTMIGIL